MEKLEPFSREELMRAVLNSDNLPSLPTVASQLVTMTADEDATLADIADLVSQDVALSTKVLKVANSAFYNFPQQIGSVAQALSILGTKAVQSLVLSFSFMSAWMVGKVEAPAKANMMEANALADPITEGFSYATSSFLSIFSW